MGGSHDWSNSGPIHVRVSFAELDNLTMVRKRLEWIRASHAQAAAAQQTSVQEDAQMQEEPLQGQGEQPRARPGRAHRDGCWPTGPCTRTSSALAEIRSTRARSHPRRRPGATRWPRPTRRCQHAALAPYLEVLDAQSSLFTVEIDEAATARDHMVALIQVYKTLGGGWPQAAAGTGQEPEQL